VSKRGFDSPHPLFFFSLVNGHERFSVHVVRCSDYSSDQLWHQLPKTHTSRRKVRSGSPVLMALGAMAGSGGSKKAQKPLPEDWRRDWPKNGRPLRKKPVRDALRRVTAAK